MNLEVIPATLIVLVLVVILAFEVLMFVDVLKNPKLTETEKIIWAFGMLLFHPVIAIVYYFTKRTSLSNPSR